MMVSLYHIFPLRRTEITRKIGIVPLGIFHSVFYKIFCCCRLNSLLQEIGNNAEPGSKTIIFVETKKKVENITRNIRRYGWPAICMHGDKSQQERDYVLSEFRNGKCTILVATDVAARGLGKHTF